jgi:hypothetical protein
MVLYYGLAIVISDKLKFVRIKIQYINQLLLAF